jgi:hypothetical protein
MRYRYCDTQKKYRTVANSLKLGTIDTSYSKKMGKKGYRYCNTQKKYRTVMKQFKSRYNNTGSISSVQSRTDFLQG